MKTLISILALASILSGAPIATTAFVTPFGQWPICESAASSAYPALCVGFRPGNETYIMAITTDDPSVVAYQYSVTAVLAASGLYVTLSSTDAGAGLLIRNDKNEFTNTLLNFGGVIVPGSAVVTVRCAVLESTPNNHR